MDVYFSTHGTSGTSGISHAHGPMCQWLASVPGMQRSGVTSFVMRNVEANPSSVIATLQNQITPRVLMHMHSNSIRSTHEIDDFREYHFIALCFNDLKSEWEWRELMHERRHLAATRIGCLPDDIIPVVWQYLH
jgi:hypothetical protein